jgi:hypothetical protein
MWLGIASFVTVGLAGVPALILGLKAKREIGAEPGRFTNAGQATAGVVLGGIGTAMFALFLVGAIGGGKGKPTASTGASASSASAAPQNDPRFPIGSTVQVGKCKFDVKDVIVAHGDKMYNWAVTGLAFATMTNDIATECGIELEMLTPSGKLIKSDFDSESVEVGYGNNLRVQTVSDSMIDSVQIRLSLRSEPGMFRDGARKEYFIQSPTSAASWPNAIEMATAAER